MEVCSCDSDPAARLHCFILHLQNFYKRRNMLSTAKDMTSIDKIKSFIETLNEEDSKRYVSKQNITQYMMESIILECFFTSFFSKHPSFAREMPPINFSRHRVYFTDL